MELGANMTKIVDTRLLGHLKSIIECIMYVVRNLTLNNFMFAINWKFATIEEKLRTKISILKHI